MRLLRQPTFLAVALSHFAVDTLNSQLGILLAVLSTPLALNNSTVGLIATLYSLVGSLTQPLFGWLSDRYGPRYSIGGGVLWMALCLSLVALAPGYWPIVGLVIGALGSAAFHAPGAAKASQVGHIHMAGQVATAASLFFLFGQGGFALGPALGGLIIDQLDRSGILILSLCAVPIGLFALRTLDPKREPAPTPAPVSRAATASAAAQADYTQFGLVLMVAAAGRWCELATATFLPKLLHDQGISATEYGIVLATFMGAGALGGVVGGILGDRWGRMRTVILAYALSVIPFFFFPNAHGLALFILAPLTGFLNGAPFSILVVTAQKALPGRGGLASGLTLGLMFAAGALGSSISGWTADQVGIALALQMNALLSVVAVVGALILANRPKSLRARVAPSAD